MSKSDTCSTCDSLNLLISANQENESDEVKYLKIKLYLHQTRAQVMQQNLKDEIKNNEIQNTDIISFGLTPSLTISLAFYLRKAWT